MTRNTLSLGPRHSAICCLWGTVGDVASVTITTLESHRACFVIPATPIPRTLDFTSAKWVQCLPREPFFEN